MSKLSRKFALYTCLLLSVALVSCKKYFGEKTDLSFIEIPESQIRQIAYVPIQPVLEGYVYPTHVLAGFDELIYVVDQGAEEIVSLDESGRVLGRLKIRGVSRVTQDRKLNLLACGLKDTTINNVAYELACLYKIELNSGLSYGLSNAKITQQIIHPFYFKNSISSSDAQVRFNDIAIIGYSEFYVARSGPNNNELKAGGPDDAVLLFNNKGEYVTPVAITSSSGFFRNYFKKPVGITSFAQPPQFTASTTNRTFVFSSIGDDAVIKVQMIDYLESDFGAAYTPRGLIVDDTSQAEGFLTSPNKFSQPYGITISGDGSNLIFVTDAAKDSLYQFTSNGLEGVRPPAISSSSKYVKTSFGGKGNELTQFNSPMGVAYLNKIVYVADAGNGRVLRFKLTTDFD